MLKQKKKGPSCESPAELGPCQPRERGGKPLGQQANVVTLARVTSRKTRYGEENTVRNSTVTKWKSDPVAFVRAMPVNLESGKP
jgi:hypothetical protein